MTKSKSILRTAIAGALAIGGTSAAVASVDHSPSAEPRAGSIVRLGDAADRSADAKAPGEGLMQVAGTSSSNSSSNSSNNSSSNSNSNSSSNSNSNSSSNSNSNSSSNSSSNSNSNSSDDDDDGDDD